MKARLNLSLIFICIALAIPLGVHAQDQVPIATPEIQPPPEQVGGQEVVPLPPPPDESAPIEGSGTLSLEQTAALPILIAARGDLELIATEFIGSGLRPVGWNGDANPDNPDLNINIRLDLEMIASQIWGESRPEGWFGVVATVPAGIARDIRHDLELVADVVMEVPTIRPTGWQGDNPVYRCGRATQAILIMLEKENLTIPLDLSLEDYCAKAELDAAIWVERNVLQPLRTETLTINADASYPFQAATAYIVAFLDRDARQKIGVLPLNTGFTALGRSTVGFSNMTLIEGIGFRVYVDWTTTPLTLEQFDSLPDFDTVSGDVYCNAEWCGVNIE